MTAVWRRKPLWMLSSLGLMASLVVVAATPSHASAGAVPTSWQAVPSPSPGISDNNLRAVACVDTHYCVAVGAYRSTGPYLTLIEIWNGTNWSITPSPSRLNPSGDTFDQLQGVSCTSRRHCVAVGFDVVGTATETLVESWNGTNWSITSSPNRGSGDNALTGVSCTSSTYCVAVGFDRAPSAQTLVETWNGSQWSITPSVDRGSDDNFLNAVSCSAANNCVAVGRDMLSETLIETWNGVSWSLRPSPNNGFSLLDGVSCTSATRCVAVGFYGTQPRRTLVETLRGTNWSITSSPNEGTSDNRLNGVSCFRANACVAVGSSDADNLTLIETWNGKSWTVSPSPQPGTSNKQLFGVSCIPPHGCQTTVGDAYDLSRNAFQTLALMRSP